MSKKNKKEKLQHQLVSKERDEIINSALKFSKKRFKQFDEIIVQLYLNEDLSRYYSDTRIAKVTECFALLSQNKHPAERAILKDAFVYLDKCSVLVSEDDLIQATYNIVRFKNYWRKDFFKWKPSSNRGDDQLKELTFYLFCQYKMADFMYKSFHEKFNMQFIKWFIHIGTGGRAKDLENIPFEFTQKMGHYFLLAPSKFSIGEALRWAQVKGLNGDDKLAARIAYSWIATKGNEHEEFWESFLRVLISGGMFNHNRITELIDYAREAKRQNINYSLKGRTLHSLLRKSDEWHKKEVLAKGNQLWGASGISEYKHEKKTETIVFEELTGSKLLAEEGKNMRHCVASYIRLCVSGKTAIFSLRKYSIGLLVETLATIEISLPTRRIVQAKAKMNKKVSEEARKYIDAWASKNDLDVSIYL